MNLTVETKRYYNNKRMIKRVVENLRRNKSNHSNHLESGSEFFSRMCSLDDQGQFEDGYNLTKQDLIRRVHDLKVELLNKDEVISKISTGLKRFERMVA